MDNSNPYNPVELGVWNSSREPAPATRGLTTTTTNVVLPHPTIPGHSQLVCEKCCRKFDLRGDLEKHRDTHRKAQVQYWCIPQCGEGYTTGAGLQRHQAYCQEIIAVQYFDPTFTPGPIAASGVSNHLTSAWHTTSIQPGGGAPSTSAAPRQSVPLHTAKGATAKGHPMMCHFPVCYRCPRDFTYRSTLEEHLAEHDRGTLVFCTTPGCGKGFPTAREVAIHQTASSCGGGRRRKDKSRDVDTPELQAHHPKSESSRSSVARHSDTGTRASTGNPAADVNVIKALWKNEDTLSLDECHLRELERSYRKSAYPTEEEMQRLNRELRVPMDVIRRWLSTRRMQG